MKKTLRGFLAAGMGRRREESGSKVTENRWHFEH